MFHGSFLVVLLFSAQNNNKKWIEPPRIRPKSLSYLWIGRKFKSVTILNYYYNASVSILIIIIMWLRRETTREKNLLCLVFRCIIISLRWWVMKCLRHIRGGLWFWKLRTRLTYITSLWKTDNFACMCGTSAITIIQRKYVPLQGVILFSCVLFSFQSAIRNYFFRHPFSCISKLICRRKI